MSAPRDYDVAPVLPATSEAMDGLEFDLAGDISEDPVEMLTIAANRLIIGTNKTVMQFLGALVVNPAIEIHVQAIYDAVQIIRELRDAVAKERST